MLLLVWLTNKILELEMKNLNVKRETSGITDSLYFFDLLPIIFICFGVIQFKPIERNNLHFIQVHVVVTPILL
jgi:hypothetical protein